MGKLEVDLKLVSKYNIPGPRYTSYPPATCFSDTVKTDTVREHIEINRKVDRELSLYFHLPFCRSLCWFCGCTTIITREQGRSAHYLKYLEKELNLVTPWINPKRKVGQLHFGGGTPTFLLPEEIRVLGRMIRDRFEFSSTIEAAVEVDPRGVTQDHILALREAGFKRISIGVQDNNPQVQNAVHRIQPPEITRQTLDWARQAGFTSLNMDLMYGLPLQTVDSFNTTLDEVLTLDPDRFAVFSYAHVPWLKRSQNALEKFLPSPEVKLALLKLCIEKLTSHGYVYIGMDHFAKEADELSLAQKANSLQRNFQGYSTHGGADIYSFGMSAISQTDTIYWQNEKDLPKYQIALDQGRMPQVKGYVLTEDDKVRRQAIMRVMCDHRVNYQDLSKRLGIDFADFFKEEIASLDDLEADGLICRHPGELEVTTTGRLLIRVIAMRFDKYLASNRERRFSKVI